MLLFLIRLGINISHPVLTATRVGGAIPISEQNLFNTPQLELVLLLLKYT
jgi:hypothetical protein